MTKNESVLWSKKEIQFHEQLKKLHEEIRQEWINLGNLPEDFPEKKPKMIIILDNASYHKKKDVIEQVEKELPNIRLEFLPAYSPDYNLIELVWHSASQSAFKWRGIDY